MAITSEPFLASSMTRMRGEQASIDELLVMVGRGEMHAFGQLYDLTVVRVLGLSRAILRNDSLAEEVVQDVYFEIWRRGATFDATRGPAISWILILAHARSVDKIRRAESLRAYDTLYARRSFYPDIDPVADWALRTYNDGQLQTALAALTVLQRQAIHLTYFLGHTNSEASCLLGIPIPTFKDRLRSALIALRNNHSTYQ